MKRDSTATTAVYESQQRQQDTNLQDLNTDLWGHIIAMMTEGPVYWPMTRLKQWTRLSFVCRGMRIAFLTMMSDDSHARELLPDLRKKLAKRSLQERAESPAKFTRIRRDLHVASFSERYCQLILGTVTDRMILTGHEAIFRTPLHMENHTRSYRRALPNLPLPRKLAAALAFDALRCALEQYPLPTATLPMEETPLGRLFLYDKTKAKTVCRGSSPAAFSLLTFGQHQHQQSIYVDALRPYGRDMCVPPNHLLLALSWETCGRFKSTEKLYSDVALATVKERLAIVTPLLYAVWSHFGRHQQTLPWYS
jgi:hypothetical protein